MNEAAMRRAQAAFDALTPPDDGPAECPECDGFRRTENSGPFVDSVVCETCLGSGRLNDDGSPYTELED